MNNYVNKFDQSEVQFFSSRGEVSEAEPEIIMSVYSMSCYGGDVKHIQYKDQTKTRLYK